MKKKKNIEEDLEKLLDQVHMTECAYWCISMAQLKGAKDLDSYESTYRRHLHTLKYMKEKFLEKYGHPVKTFTYIREYEAAAESTR